MLSCSTHSFEATMGRVDLSNSLFSIFNSAWLLNPDNSRDLLQIKMKTEKV